MKNIKRIVSIILSVFILFAFVSCGKKDADEGGSITLTDQAGRTISLDKPAEKVVSCYYVTSYAMLSLGISNKIVGIEKKAESRPVYSMISDASLTELTQVGSLKEINIEVIVSLEPELVLIPKKLSDYAETIESLGIKAMIVDPEDDEKLRTMISLIAQACGVSERADKLLAYYDEKSEEIIKITENSVKPNVVICSNSSYMSVAPGEMYQNHIIELAGGINAAASLQSDYWCEISYETWMTLNPDYIIIPSGASYTSDDILLDEDMKSLDAVKNGNIYKMPNSIEEWDSPIPSGILGSLWTASVIHSDLYTKQDFANEVKEFYTEFYGFTPSDEILSEIQK